MKRLTVTCCALLFCVGCASDGNKGQWDEFWKDLRGDNMKMRSDLAREAANRPPPQDKPAE